MGSSRPGPDRASGRSQSGVAVGRPPFPPQSKGWPPDRLASGPGLRWRGSIKARRPPRDILPHQAPPAPRPVRHRLGSRRRRIWPGRVRIDPFCDHGRRPDATRGIPEARGEATGKAAPQFVNCTSSIVNSRIPRNPYPASRIPYRVFRITPAVSPFNRPSPTVQRRSRTPEPGGRGRVRGVCGLGRVGARVPKALDGKGLERSG